MANCKQKRIFSMIVDMIVSNFIGAALLSLFNLEMNVQLGKLLLFGLELDYGYSFQAIIILLYFIIFDISNKGRSSGKLLFSIQVVDRLSLQEISIIRRIQRTVLKVLGIIILPVSLLMFFAFDITIHDSVVKTMTIKV